MSYLATRCHQVVQYCPEIPSEDSKVFKNVGDRRDKEHGNDGSTSKDKLRISIEKLTEGLNGLTVRNRAKRVRRRHKCT